MWGLIQQLFRDFISASPKTLREQTSIPPLGVFWLPTSGNGLAQGDLLRDCLVPVFGPDVRPDVQSEVVICQIDLIVLTQSCDLENKKVQFVALCPIYTLEEFGKYNPKFKKLAEFEEVRKGRIEGLHMLASPLDPTKNADAFIVDFRQIHSIPFNPLSEHAGKQENRWRLQSPYLEHFSQAFARFFMRVGLPSAIPPFK